MKKLIFKLSLILFLLSLPLFAWSQDKDQLLVYCGITMLKPMQDLAGQFEKTHDCKISFVTGGSGKLISLVLKNKNGDLFLPGSDSYVKTLEKENPGLVMDARAVGHNRAAIFVKKGNPLEIKPDLDNLMNPAYRVIIGSAEQGSIGKETRKILETKGIYDKVLSHAKVTLHSESLVNAIKGDKADITINWYAVSTWPENRDGVDALPIDEAYAPKKKLSLALLSHSRHPDLARAFLDLVASETGRTMFRQYGLD